MERSWEPSERWVDVARLPLAGRVRAGMGLAFGGISWALSKKELRALSVLTVMMNLVLYGALLAVGFRYLGDAAAWLGPDPANLEGLWRSLAELWQGVLRLLLGIAWVLSSVFLALAAGNVLAGPLLDLLSERTERLVLGRSLAPQVSLIGIVRNAVRELLVQLGLLAVYLPVVLAILLVGLLPLVGQVLAPVLTWMWASLWVTLTFTTQSTARHGLGVSARLRLVRQHVALGVGFGGPQSVVPFLLIPLLAPGLVVGGTRLYLALAAWDRVESRLTEADKALLRAEPGLLLRQG